MNHEFLWNKKRLWFWILLGVAFVLSFVTPLRLDEGGELTCFSMLVICLIGYFLGGSKGVLAAVIFGVLRFLVGFPYADNLAEIIDDLGFSGRTYFNSFFKKQYGVTPAQYRKNSQLRSK